MGRIDAGAKKSMDFGGEEKDILESERVCDRHFVAGKKELHGTSTTSVGYRL